MGRICCCCGKPAAKGYLLYRSWHCDPCYEDRVRKTYRDGFCNSPVVLSRHELYEESTLNRVRYNRDGSPRRPPGRPRGGKNKSTDKDAAGTTDSTATANSATDTSTATHRQGADT